MKYLFKIFFLFSLLLFYSCSKEIEPTGINIYGSIQIGPFISGNNVELIGLDKNLNPTGETMTTQTYDDLGHYMFKNVCSPYVRIQSTGYYYNTVYGLFSEEQIPASVIARSNYNINVNAFTCIEQLNVLEGLKKGLSFDESKKKAINGLLLFINVADTTSLTAEQISLFDYNKESLILNAFSAQLLTDESIRVQAYLQCLLSDFKDGSFECKNRDKLYNKHLKLNECTYDVYRNEILTYKENYRIHLTEIARSNYIDDFTLGDYEQYLFK